MMHLHSKLQFTLISALIAVGISVAHAELPPVDGGAPVPVIDVHTHVFNARDLPMFGVLNSRRKPVPVPAAIAAILKDVMIAWTPVDDLDDATPEGKGVSREQSAQSSLQEKIARSGRRLTDAERRKLAAFVNQPQLVSSQKLSRIQQDQNDIELVARSIDRADFPPSDAAVEKKSAPETDKSALLGFLDLLDIMTDGNRRIAWRLKTEEYPKADLFVHHMMDMEKGYGELPARGFDDQMERMNQLDRQFEGALLHFVAFDPFRREQSLENVIRGLRAGGVGVKFYPPTGYRATGNRIPKRPGWFASSHRKQRWDSRYKNLSNDQLDGFNDAFFRHCVSNDIPVFAHCTPVGFEADKDYGWMADPQYWAQVLSNHPALRLCFGHSGGEAYWFPDPKEKADSAVHAARAFGTNVVDLCLRYPNVFCEVGFLDPALNPNQIGFLRTRLQSVLNTPSSVGAWKFGDKIMYGTDWHMMHAVSGHRDYLDRFHALFADPEFAEWHRKFFTGNAVQFLKLATLAKDDRFSEEQRLYWQRLVSSAVLPSVSRPDQ